MAAASATPRSIFAKNATISRIRPMRGMTIWPLMPWIGNPMTPSKSAVWLSTRALSTTPPPSMNADSPNTA